MASIGLERTRGGCCFFHLSNTSRRPCHRKGGRGPLCISGNIKKHRQRPNRTDKGSSPPPSVSPFARKSVLDARAEGKRAPTSLDSLFPLSVSL